MSDAKYTLGAHRLQQRELMGDVGATVFEAETQDPGLPWSTDGTHPVQCRERLSGPLESQFVSEAVGSGTKDAATRGGLWNHSPLNGC